MRTLLASFVLCLLPTLASAQGDPSAFDADRRQAEEAALQAAFPNGAPPAPVLGDSTPVRLPWSEVARLLEQSRKERPARAPLPFALGAARFEGESDGRLLTLRVSLPVHLFDDGWSAVPLWRTPVAVRRATLDGKPAALAQEGGSLVLLARGAGEHSLQAELVLAPSSGEQVRLGFATPTAATWNLRLPGTTARAEPAVHQVSRPERGATVLEATTAPTDSVAFDWTGARTLSTPARVSAESFTYVTFSEGTTFGRATFEFQITGGSRDRVQVALPPAMELLGAEAKDLAHWSVESTPEGKRLVATFARAQRGRVALQLTFELPKPADVAALPVLSALEVAEQRAFLAVSAESPVSVAPEQVQGGEAVDVKHLPAHLLRGVTLPFTLAWRHAGEGFSGSVRIARHATVALPQATIDAAYFTSVLTEEGEEVVKATFLVKNNLKPYLTITLPEGALLWASFVSGESVNPVFEGGKVALPLVKSRDVGSGDTLAMHQVEEGWSLSDLALTYYHDASKWRSIVAANKGLFQGNEQAQVGQNLVIPRLDTAPGASDLETAFPVELVYSRKNRTPGLAGAVEFQVPSTDLGVMNVVWTVYLPSRVDPLHFAGNLAQASYLRYGVFRRLQHLWSGQAALDLGVGTSEALAGGGSLSKRFAFEEEAGKSQAARSYPRVSLPLVGRPYVFKRSLLEGDQPHLRAVYLDRRVATPVRWLALGLGFALALWLSGAGRRRPSAPRALLVSGLFLAGTLGVGHFLLGTHGRAATGLLLGAWFSLVLTLFLRPLPAGSRLARAWHRALRYSNAAVLLLAVLLGLNAFTSFLGVVAAVPALLSLWRSRASGQSIGGPAAIATTLLALLLAVPGQVQAAQSPDLPPSAEVTLPYSTLRDLVEQRPTATPPSRRATLLGADYTATLQPDAGRLLLKGRALVDVHAEGWVEILLVGRSHALTGLTLDGRPAAASVRGDRYVLPLRGVGAHTLEFTAQAKADPGSARLELLPGVAGALTVQLPANDLAPELSPASEVRVEGATLRGLLPADGHTELLWSPQGAAVPGEATPRGEVRTVARTLQIVSAQEQRVRVFAAVRYQVQRGAENRFAVTLPEGVELLDVQGEGMAEHGVETVDGRSRLVATTLSLVRDQFELSFAYDWRPPKEGGTLPVFRVENVRSETGTLGIESAGNLEVQLAGVDGAAAIDVRSAPELFGHTDKPVLHAVRYLQHPYTVRLSFVQHPEKELDTATVDHAAYTSVVGLDGRVMTRGVYRMRNARQPFLGLQLPAGAGLESELQSVLVGGEPAKPVRDAQGRLLLPLMRSPSSEREMRQFEVEVVYLTRVAGMARSGALPGVLPAVDLRVSQVAWSLYLPPGIKATERAKTEAARDHMQWATAPRALWARALAPRTEREAIASGGILPVRFNLPEHGTPEQFFRHYLPADAQPVFRVAYAPRSLPAVAQGALALLLFGVVGGALWILRRRRAA